MCVTLLYQFIPQKVMGSINITQYLYYLVIFISLPFIFNYFKSNKLDRYNGELSYPMYISHLLVISILTVSESIFSLNQNFKGICVALLTIVVSTILYKFVSKSIEIYRSKLAMKQVIKNRFIQKIK